MPVVPQAVDPLPIAHSANDGTLIPISWSVKVVNLVAILLPLAGLTMAIILLWGWGFSWTHLGIMLGMYLLTVLGVTVGYHRLLTHKSFETPRFMKVLLCILGSMAVQGSVIKWVATHRRHHQHSDHDGDPHSPHLHGGGVIGFIKGFLHAHLGWLFKAETSNLLTRYARDLMGDRALLITDKLFTVWVAIGLLIPAALGLWFTHSWKGALLGFIWGGLVRVFLVHHVTWSVNSICHVWGSRPFRSHDHSTNNALFAIFSLGEGWHNNHHAFPTSARHGLRWWQIDVSYYVIKAMEIVGLAWKVRVPAAATMAAKRA